MQSRRNFLTMAAAQSLLAADGTVPHFTPKAKRVLMIFCSGALSHVDTFDWKPELVKRDGEDCPESLLKGRRFAFIGGRMQLAGSKFTFAKHGRSGQEMSNLLPHLAKVADEIAIVKTLHTEEINHAPAQMFLHSGFGRGGRPSFGAWVTYGLGTASSDLPAYVVLLSGPAGGAGTSMLSTGFLPSVYQGVQFRSSGEPVLFLNNPKSTTRDERRRVDPRVGRADGRDGGNVASGHTVLLKVLWRFRRSRPPHGGSRMPHHILPYPRGIRAFPQ